MIISRGYGRKSKGVQVVSDGAGKILDPLIGGDEPVLMAKRLKHVPVLVAEKRVSGIKTAIVSFQPDLIILDDAFQHRYLARDCDIVLIDHRRALDQEHLLPAGKLREPIINLKRASFIVYTHADLPPEDSVESNLSKYFSGPVFHSAHTADCIVDCQMRPMTKLTDMRGNDITAFAGIANPDDFRRELEKIGLNIKKFSALPDHHTYEGKWLADFIGTTKQLGCRHIITTEKDLVKLPGNDFKDVQVCALRVKIIVHNPEKLVQTIHQYIDKSVIHN